MRKVYDEKIAYLDRQLSQEIKQHQTKTRQMKTVITQLVKQKEELEKN
jgi:mRNA-degrading endonuclease YafQ of YafQ-DinJ toxin-antitoxin module